jgi:hypothetical protein
MEEQDNTGNYIMSIFYERMVNRGFAIFFTLVVIVTIFGSCFSLLLGYAQVGTQYIQVDVYVFVCMYEYE